MRRALVLLVVLLATSLIGVRPSQAQFATCDHAYVATWDVAASGGSPAWSAGPIECVEYFRFSFRTPHGERWIRGIGDVNLDTMITPGAVRAIERGAQRAAQRFAALGEYNIENTTILMSFSTAESLANEPASGRTAAWTMAGHGTTPATQECRITMFLLDDYSVDVELPHAVAHELFHCVESGSLTVAQFEARGRADNWWIEGAAELFAAVVVGNDNVRWDRARQFREAVEEETPVYRMGYAAAVLFWWMYDQYGLEALMPLLREAPESGYPGAQRQYLREAFDDGEWLQFVKAYTNGTIRYPGMSTSRLSAPDGEIWSIDANETRRLALEPFVITLGWANYGCGRWGNSVNRANAETRQGESWQRWPAETDSRAGGARYRVAAMHTGEEPGELTLRVEGGKHAGRAWKRP